LILEGYSGLQGILSNSTKLDNLKAKNDRAIHAGFEKVGLELCSAGSDSKQFEELTTCNPGGSDSPKLRTASARSGGMYLARS